MGSPERTQRKPWGPGRIVFWALLTVIALTWLGPRFVAAFRPPEGMLMDFVQEWLSAKSYWGGTPVYTNQIAALRQYAGMAPRPGESMLYWNGHPPTAVVLALPFAFLDYPDAHLLWNLLTFPLFVASIVLVIRELGVPYQPLSVLPTIALVVLFQPLYLQLMQGQLNFVLLFLLVLTWVAHRRGYQVGAGAALGTAAAVKLFPAFLFLYFVANRQWRVVWSGLLWGAALTGFTAAILGLDAYATYVREVVPHLQRYWGSAWENVSLPAFWLRLFEPWHGDGATPIGGHPELGRILGIASQLIVIGVVAAVAWGARTPDERDRAYSLGIVGALLVSPITWPHSFLLLLIPVGLLWTRLPSGWWRRTLGVLLVAFWLPDRFFLILGLGPAKASAIINTHRELISTGAGLIITAHTYALVSLFALLAVAPLKWAEETVGPAGSAGDELWSQ